MSSRKTLFIIDGTALAYRAFYAMARNPLVNSRGLDTSAVFGFTNSLFSILRSEKPDSLVCVFDARGPTFRHERYPEYKATREKMPEEMAAQLPLIQQVLEVLRVPTLEKQGYEADDIMATLALKAAEKGMRVFMVTGDKDMMQVVSDSIRMYSFGRGMASGEIVIRDPESVRNKMGVGPEQIIDYLGLTGDSSDNIPGVPGIGPKTAAKLLADFGSLDNLYGSLAGVDSDNLRTKLEEHREQAFLSRELVTLDTDVPLNVGLDDLKMGHFDRGAVEALFKELEFQRLLRSLPDSLAGEEESGDELPRHYTVVTTAGALRSLVQALSRESCIAFDTETTSVDPMRADLVGLSFSWKEGEAWYVPVRVPEADRKGDLFQPGRADLFNSGKDPTETFVLEQLRPILENREIKKCGQNIKYDVLVLRRCGIEAGGIDFDTMVAAYLINPSARSLSIDTLAQEYLGMRKIPTSDLIGSGASRITMDRVPLQQVAEYACEDADAAWRLRKILEKKLTGLDMLPLFRDIEMPLIPVLIEMEYTGVAIDSDLMAEISLDLEKKMQGLMSEIYDIAGEEFNINSPKQLGVILYEKLEVHKDAGWKRVRRTKTGYATDVKVLEALSIHPLPRKILDYRQLKKLQSTYVDALPKLVNPETGRIHTSFNQTVTATGRLSTSDPNLQNIPVRTELGREIRKAFIPGHRGWRLVSADYSQIELRIMAHVSKDETLIASFKNNEDVHRRVAAEIFSIDPRAVTDEQRRMAKTINFGVMYGMGAYGLASRLHISNSEAQEFIDAYFSRYPNINLYVAETIATAGRDGYVTTLLNRRRVLPEITSENRNMRTFAERTAVNTPIQGTAADIIKIAMIAVFRRLKREGFKAKMILQIHDELLFEAPEEEVETLTAMVKEEMERALTLDVPIVVEAGAGNSWFEAH
ncbi:DNA polymerase I [bacterium]|nr:DNA polymerase I [bacterium]